MPKETKSLKEILTSINLCLSLLDRSDKIRLSWIVGLQFTLVFLDLIGVFLIGTVASIGVSSVQNEQYSNFVANFLELLNLGNQSSQNIAVLLGCGAGLALIAKSVFSFRINRKIMQFLGNRELLVANKLLDNIIDSRVPILHTLSSAEFYFALNAGARNVTAGVLGQAAILMGEFVLQFAMFLIMFLYSPLLMFFSLLYFCALFLVLNFFSGKRASKWGLDSANYAMQANLAISMAVESFREIVATGKEDYISERILRAKRNLITTSINQSMLSQFSKYAFEIGIVVAGLLVSAFAFFSQDAVGAVGFLAVFLAASSRIAPSLLKIQVGWLSLLGAVGGTAKFFSIKHATEYSADATESKASKEILDWTDQVKEDEGFSLKNVSFSYPLKKLPVLGEISFSIDRNSMCAIVGPSGSGKSTLTDLILGVLNPSSGLITFQGVSITTLRNHKKIKISYVPQNVYIFPGTIEENVCFGIENHERDRERALSVLKMVGLNSLVDSFEGGISHKIGERGLNLSGGQKQRLGIARALYSQPDVLVLDEATSSLDAISEELISKVIQNLSASLTVIVVAHRLSTIREADRIIYVDFGRVIVADTFDELRKTVPDFDKQAEIMGIET